MQRKSYELALSSTRGLLRPANEARTKKLAWPVIGSADPLYGWGESGLPQNLGVARQDEARGHGNVINP